MPRIILIVDGSIPAAPRVRFVAVVLLAAACLAGPRAVAAQHVSATEDGLVQVEARNVTLAALLDELSRATPLNMKVEPESGARRVTVSQPPLPPLEAVQALLKSADVDFLVVGGGAGRPARVIIGGARAVTAAQTPTSPVAPAAVSTAVLAPELQADIAAMRDDEPVGDEPDETPVVSPEAQKAMTDQLVALMGGTPKAPRRGTLQLPFMDANGQPLTIHSDARPTDDAQLPFPGPDGTSPLTVPRVQPASEAPPPPTLEEVPDTQTRGSRPKNNRRSRR